MADKITLVDGDMLNIKLYNFGGDSEPLDTLNITVWHNTVFDGDEKISVNMTSAGDTWNGVYGVMDRESAIALRDHLTALIEGTL